MPRGIATDDLVVADSTASVKARSAMPEIDVGHDRQRPDVHREQEQIGVEAGRNDPTDASVRHERLVEDGVEALRRSHAERVPLGNDRDTLGVAVDETVHDHRCLGIGQIDAVHTEHRPHRAVRPEHLPTTESITALDSRRERRRHDDRSVVAGLGVTSRDDPTGQCLVEHPAARRVTESFELGGDADPVRVHRHRQGGRRGERREPTLEHGELGEVQSPAAELGRHRGGQVADLTEHREILVDVGVVGVGTLRTDAELFELAVGRKRAAGESGGGAAIDFGDGHGWLLSLM